MGLNARSVVETHDVRRRACGVAIAIATGVLAWAPEAAAGSQRVAAGSQAEPRADGEASAAASTDDSRTTASSTTASSTTASSTTASSSETDPAPSRLTRYLQRPVRLGAHFLDHGVLQAAVAGGYPHRYRVELALGVLDHLTLGATAHWLPGQPRPQVSPVVALAFVRTRLFEVGARYFWSLYPPPVDDLDPATSSYQRSAQWILGTASFGQAWLTGGLDAGVVRARVNDPGMDPEPDTSNPSTIRWMFGGGLHLRAGTRRWGFTAQVLVPQLAAEVRFDLRFGLFEKRSRGGWKPYGMAEDWDRPVPW